MILTAVAIAVILVVVLKTSNIKEQATSPAAIINTAMTENQPLWILFRSKT